MRLMSHRSCFRTLLLLLATSSFITFTFLLRCHNNGQQEGRAQAELLVDARSNAVAVGVVGRTVDANSADSRPEDISSRRRIAEHHQDSGGSLQPQHQPQQQRQRRLEEFSNDAQRPQQEEQGSNHQQHQQLEQIANDLQQVNDPQQDEQQPFEQFGDDLPEQQENPLELFGNYPQQPEPQLQEQFSNDQPQQIQQQQRHLEQISNDQDPAAHVYKEMDCLINGDYTIKGHSEGSEVYLPFSFIRKYFEVQGQIVQSDGTEHFEWQHSNAKIYFQQPYKSDGLFMSFNHYNVEARNRVKYICGVEGVPLSNQWDQQSYYYPIQIAQFGLTHYCKNLTESPPTMTVYKDASSGDLSAWSSPDPRSQLRIIDDEEQGSLVLEFKTAGEYSLSSIAAWSRVLDSKSDFVLSFDLKLLANASVTIVAEREEAGKFISMHYVSGEDGFRVGDGFVVHGLGPVARWRTITRNLQVDYRKTMAFTLGIHHRNKPIRYLLQRLVRIELRGHGRIANIVLARSRHMRHFFDAADWLVNHQDARGGWSIKVERVLDGMTLPPEWYSAMAQGQAMSTLARAFIKTRRKKYLQAALRATGPFQYPSSEGGITAKFMDKFTWYEEYPTSPSSFVLNGFIYSLIGLYDLLTVAERDESRDAQKLFDEGMASLKAMLPLFDVGSGTTYDLRHVALGKAPNLARWDYHATHISQLQLLASIDSSPIFKETVARWIGYTKGKRAKHN
ncbi:D-glucuronyl C5-epimerase B-like [Diadema antillarum]|uniref:D-glucuronyl C5-epimerase B-like n=1 Tax=Diadema antillarum TaxID=105358 RepID=UPI003A8A4F6D